VIRTHSPQWRQTAGTVETGLAPSRASRLFGREGTTRGVRLIELDFRRRRPSRQNTTPEPSGWRAGDAVRLTLIATPAAGQVEDVVPLARNGSGDRGFVHAGRCRASRDVQRAGAGDQKLSDPMSPIRENVASGIRCHTVRTAYLLPNRMCSGAAYFRVTSLEVVQDSLGCGEKSLLQVAFDRMRTYVRCDGKSHAQQGVDVSRRVRRSVGFIKTTKSTPSVAARSPCPSSAKTSDDHARAVYRRRRCTGWVVDSAQGSCAFPHPR